ncbi:hypothetical protein BX616_011341, partial [Lobosporangium transversale]
MPRDSSSGEPLLGQHRQNNSNNTSSKFGITVEQLAPLTDPTNPTLPSDLGGIDKICKDLKVDPKVGLRSDEADESSLGHSDAPKFEARTQAFGRN